MAYDTRKSDMGKWVAPVQANRKAETLDFAPAVKTNLSNAALAAKMEATTDMEKEVEMLLTAGGASEAGLAENEMEELKSKAYTVEEVKERQAELSKMRALMFYQERKQHHMNKIKSKVYRKIKKRQRDRAGDAQQEDEGELGEVAARKRAEERMSLRHKNTSKWVKNALRAKGGAGKDDRKAIAEQLKIGQELRAKMGGVDGNSSEDSSSSEEEEGEGGASNGKKRRSALKNADREELERIGGDDDDEDGIAMSGKGAALMKMAFMQKAMEKQRERAREEASVVLRELEEASAAAAADADGSDDDEAVRRNKRSNKRGSKAGDAAGTAEGVGAASKETRAEATAEVAKALPAGALQSSSVSMDARVRSSVASPITIDLGGGSGPVLSSAEDKAETLNGSKKKSTGGGGKAGTEERSKKRRQEEADGGVADRGLEGEEEEEDDQQDGKSNPWLAPTPRRSKSRRRAPNGEVLLDVRKAAATALSAFGGKEGPSGSGDAADDVVEHEGGGGANDAGNGSAGPLSSGKNNKNKKNKNNSPPNEQAEQEQGGGRKKRKRRKRGGGGGGGAGDVNGHEGASGDGTNGEGTEARATTDKAGGGNKKAKTAASESNGKSGVKRSGASSTATPKLVGLSNDELVRRAFAAPDFESEFKDSKDDEVEGEIAKGREKLPGTLAGWGAWAGDGVPAPRGPTKHQVQAKNAQGKKEETIRKARKD
ncbi:unnamed protein product, partial [Ectocarpus fasciculatus]